VGPNRRLDSGRGRDSEGDGLRHDRRAAGAGGTLHGAGADAMPKISYRETAVERTLLSANLCRKASINREVPWRKDRTTMRSQSSSVSSMEHFQAAGAPQLHLAPPEPHSLQEGEAGKTAQAQKQGQVRRPSHLERPKLRAREVLMGASNLPVL
jgi:hypothetical protein